MVITLNKGRQIARSLPGLIGVGSLIYGKPKIGDIDFITLLTPYKVIELIEKKYPIKKVLASGKKKLFVEVIIKGKVFEFNIWFANRETLPFLIFGHSYPKKFNIKIRNLLKKKAGITLGDYGIRKGHKAIKSFRDKKGKLRYFKKSKDFFDFANMYGNIPFRTPKQEYLKNLKGGIGIGEIFNRVKGFFQGARQGIPPVVKQFLEVNGHYNITNMVVCRSPIKSVFDKVINLISLGQYQKNKDKYHYDNLFHLYILARLNNGQQYRIEKNQVIEIYQSNEKGLECKPVHMKGPINVTKFIENGNKYQMRLTGHNNYFNYNPIDNNCQVFIYNTLAGNSLINKDLGDFIKQNVSQVLTGHTGTIANAITDLGARADILLHGRGRPKKKYGGCNSCTIKALKNK